MMNKHLRMAIMMVLCLCFVLPVGGFSEQAAGAEVIIRSDDADELAPLYSSPDGDVIGAYYAGVPAILLEGETGGMVKLQIGSVDGYMDIGDIVTDPTVSVASEMPLMWSTDATEITPLYLRALPGDEAEELDKLASAEVEVMGEAIHGQTDELWYHVRVRGETGYMRASRLTPIPIADAVSSATTVAAVTCTPDTSMMISLMDGLVPGGADGFPKASYFSGVPLEVLGEVTFPDTTWVMVRVDWFTTGFMNKEYIREGDECAEARKDMIQMEAVKAEGVAARIRLHVRPNDTSAILGEYADGTPVTMLGVWESGRWVHVEMGGQRGYLHVENIRQAQD